MTTADPVLKEIVDRFLDRLDTVVDDSTQAIWEAIPGYARSDEALLDDVRSSVRGNVEVLAGVLSESRELRRDELRLIEAVGARRAEAGIPLDDVLHAYRTVSRVCWDFLAHECRSKGAGALEAAIELAEAVLRYTDQISTAVAEAYSRAQRTIVREQEGARREFLADLLYGTESSPEDVLQRAHTFGYDLSLSYLALVGSDGQTDGNTQESALSAALSDALPGPAAEPIVLQKGEQAIALLPVDASSDIVALPEKLLAELGGRWRLGVGGPERGLEGIRRAYLEAREAFEVGLALELPANAFRFDDLLLYHFLRLDQNMVGRFVTQMLGALISYDERRKGELVKTLEAYFASDGSVKLAGEMLFAHPHTVTYRLKQIERLSGWSLRDPEDKLRLQLALRANRLQRAHPAGS